MTDEQKQKRKFLNRELPVFAFFLLLSFVFWYLNELSKDLKGTINYPVRYINPPKDRIVTGDLPDKLEMELRGPGYSILKVKLSGSRAPVVVDFSRMAPRRLPGTTPQYYLMTAGLINSFAKQLHADFEILSIQPDTLFFGYDRLVTRKMPVKPNLSVDLAEGRKVIIVPAPDSITVTGPAHILDTLNGIRTRHRHFKRMNENFRSKVPLEYPEYLQTTQKRVTVEVTITGKPDSFFGLKQGKDK
ncbi:MAG: YbbR-like domain-containing protein [Bacteroidales bacterium]